MAHLPVSFSVTGVVLEEQRTRTALPFRTTHVRVDGAVLESEEFRELGMVSQYAYTAYGDFIGWELGDEHKPSTGWISLGELARLWQTTPRRTRQILREHEATGLIAIQQLSRAGVKLPEVRITLLEPPSMRTTEQLGLFEGDAGEDEESQSTDSDGTSQGSPPSSVLEFGLFTRAPIVESPLPPDVVPLRPGKKHIRIDALVLRTPEYRSAPRAVRYMYRRLCQFIQWATPGSGLDCSSWVVTQEEIGAALGISARQARTLLHELEARGLIAILDRHHRSKDGRIRQRACRYVLLEPLSLCPQGQQELFTEDEDLEVDDDASQDDEPLADEAAAPELEDDTSEDASTPPGEEHRAEVFEPEPERKLPGVKQTPNRPCGDPPPLVPPSGGKPRARRAKKLDADQVAFCRWVLEENGPDIWDRAQAAEPRLLHNLHNFLVQAKKQRPVQGLGVEGTFYYRGSLRYRTLALALVEATRQVPRPTPTVPGVVAAPPPPVQRPSFEEYLLTLDGIAALVSREDLLKLYEQAHAPSGRRRGPRPHPIPQPHPAGSRHRSNQNGLQGRTGSSVVEEDKGNRP